MRYQYTSPGAKGLSSMRLNLPNLFPAGVRLLMIINLAVFTLMYLSGLKYAVFSSLGLIPAAIWQEGRFWQLFTYLFLHDGIAHLLINMFVLWMFGRGLEMLWGKQKFLKYYFITGLGAGLITAIFTWSSTIPVVGASGAIYGLLLAYGVLFPNQKAYIYFIFPVKMKYLVMVMAGIAFFLSLTPGASPISHLTHLSGMVIGFVYLRKNWIRSLFESKKSPAAKTFTQQKSEGKAPEGRLNDSLMQRRVNDVLDKMQDVGWEGLTASEQNILFDASRKYSQDQSPN